MNKTIPLGKYEDSNPYLLSPFGYPVLVFDDAVSVISEEGLYREREMNIDGKPFQIRSIFPNAPSSNATEKLIHLIDSNIGKKEK